MGYNPTGGLLISSGVAAHMDHLGGGMQLLTFSFMRHFLHCGARSIWITAASSSRTRVSTRMRRFTGCSRGRFSRRRRRWWRWRSLWRGRWNKTSAHDGSNHAAGDRSGHEFGKPMDGHGDAQADVERVEQRARKDVYKRQIMIKLQTNQ